MDVKRQNQEIRKEMYPQSWRENTNQTKVLSIVDYQQGTFNMDILESKFPITLSHTDYKATQMKMKLGDVHPMDMIELHKKTSDIHYRGVLQSTPNVQNMKNTVLNID
jgi:hypothetical protein